MGNANYRTSGRRESGFVSWQNGMSHLLGPSQKADLRHLGDGAHSQASLNVTRATTGEFKKRRHSHVSDQSNANRLSRQQRRGSQQRQLHSSLVATKSSYKKNGGYTSHTEWHRCVVFGKISEFAKTLTKGAHIQVEGELRSRV